ncbi:NEDD8-conjugating protein ubc12 [Tilletia horrida]|nr:NEDD8-conjugating protein ubc12 [Tilletia horrida]KAK0567291.1 NEDD8-conjugating protein ubc12 [Tilletia horrida]
MMKIWSMKKEEESVKKRKPKTTPAQLRVQKDLTELELPATMKTEFPDAADVLNFNLIIEPDEGMYKSGSFKFTFAINSNYPHDPPKVKCLPKIYHPNVDLQGNVCLNILREDWKPVLNLNAVMVGLQYLFLEPNADDPLNKEAAEDLRRDRTAFASNVKRTLGGGSFKGVSYDKVTK